MNITFKFPESIDNYRAIRNALELNSLIKQEKDFKDQHVKYGIINSKKIYLYAKCRLCSSRMTFRYCQVEQLFKLTKFQNDHCHSIRLAHRNIALGKFISDLPQNFSLQAAKMITMNTFPGVTESQFYHCFRRIKNPSLSFRQLINKLDNQQYEILSDPFESKSNELPQLLIITNDEMKTKFEKYGSFVGFDTTYHLIKQRKDGKIFKVGIFCGLSLSRKIVPYCLVVVLQETKERFYEIFRSFTNLMRLSPKFIITDESSAMIAAIKQLKQDRQIESNHVFDIFHLARNIKKRLTRKQNLTYFMQLLKSRTQRQFQTKLQEAYQNIQTEQISILEQLVTNKSQNCYAYLQSQLIGFSCSNSFNEKVHDLLKSRIPREQPFTQTVLTSLRLMNQLLAKCDTWQIERIPIERYHFGQLKQIRYSVDKHILQEFCKQLQKLVYIDKESIRDNVYGFYDQRLDWHLSVFYEAQIWKCQCRFIAKSGIPCAHIIKACLISQRRIIKAFNKRWLINQVLLPIPKRNSTGKITRRNRR